MDIKKSFFELFGLPESFSVDKAVLSERYRELQKTVHPDRFAHLSDQERRIAVQYTSYLNEGFATLKSPLLLAQYLLTLKGIDMASEGSTRMDPMFLMQQMELREQVEDLADAADPESAIDQLSEEVSQSVRQLQQAFESALHEDDLLRAEEAVRKMQFFDKLNREIDELEDELI